jgi:hypothetical protein
VASAARPRERSLGERSASKLGTDQETGDAWPRVRILLQDALRDLASALTATAAQWMIIGGIAVIARGVRRFTADIDAAVRGDEIDDVVARPDVNCTRGDELKSKSRGVGTAFAMATR